MRTFASVKSPLRTLTATATLAVALAAPTQLLAAPAQPEQKAEKVEKAEQREQTGKQDQQQDRQKIVITMRGGTDDLHASVMALELAKALLDEGAEVTLFVNLEAVRLLDARQPDDLRWGSDSRTIGQLYRAVVRGGGEVLVCPHCADAVGLTAKELRDGARIARLGEVAEAILAADKVIDY